MNTKKFLSTMAIIVTMSVPILFANQAQASDRYVQKDERHAYRDGYRDSRNDDRHERRRYGHQQRRHYSGHGYKHGYYRAHHGGHHNYRPYAHNSAFKLIFHF